MTTIETLAAEVRAARAAYEATRAARARGEVGAAAVVSALWRIERASRALVFHAGGAGEPALPAVNVACAAGVA